MLPLPLMLFTSSLGAHDGFATLIAKLTAVAKTPLCPCLLQLRIPASPDLCDRYCDALRGLIRRHQQSSIMLP
ncbi:hypothetical protein M758_3G178200 [Ceratodon purpureus]|nr:hypothetical protein M758_3G178200 [Ceratodon purpureus]